MLKLLRFLQALILVLWLGAMFFFAFVVAPTVFEVLPTQHWAGEVVRVTLHKFNFIAGISLLLFILICFLVPIVQKRRTHWGERILIALAVVALAISLYSQFGVERKMDSLRAEAGILETHPPDDPLQADDPLRMEFDRLHRRSVNLFGTNMILGLLMLGMWTRQS